MRIVLVTALALLPGLAAAQQWEVNSLTRPRPRVVDPGPERPPGPAPDDAIVLFDGRDLSEWTHDNGTPARWRVGEGFFEVVAGTGTLRTRREFGDIQLHLEWATPAVVQGEGQERGNSGLFLMGYYEIQILDSYRNETYGDGQAAALYGQTPPLVNASRAPGKWQTYDVVFHAPRYGPDGAVVDSARATVFHNGVLVHNAVAFTGRTRHAVRARYEPHGPRGPITLQDHGNPVRFRNVWVRELES